MAIPETMTAVLLTGYGEFDKLYLRHDVPVPQPGPGDVLIRVAAAAINNTDINTRIGWYARTQGETESWSGTALNFPLIQGADCCGHVVGVGDNVDAGRIGERVIVRGIMKTPVNHAPGEFWVFGSECDGSFAQYTIAASAEVDAVNCDWSDAELSTIPVAYSTAEAMLERVSLGAERVLVTGASGGVGTAALQLAKRRGATVIAVAAMSKADQLLAMGADQVIDRDADLVAGPTWPALPVVLRRYGRYVVAGAVAGPIVPFDVRNLYLKDQTFFGVTYREDLVSENLVKYIEANDFRPVVARTYPLEEIVQAQKDFLAKKFVGKLVLVPPGDAA
jgi:NADPH:quinone reductase-like Zn-dependent oxidoreductase